MVDDIEGLKDFKDSNDVRDPNVETFNLLGRRVTTLQPGIIYIRNGKKIILNK